MACAPPTSAKPPRSARSRGLPGVSGGSLAAYQALIDAVFTAPGAAEWLARLRRRVAAILAVQDAARRQAVACDAIRAAEPGPGRV
jgi:hypothetical protein